MTRRRRRHSRIPFGIYGALIAILFVVWIVSLALDYWYVTVAILAVVAGVFYWRKEKRKRAAEREGEEAEAEWEANRQAWREVTWDEGPYSVIVSGFAEPDNADLVFLLLSDAPTFRDHSDAEMGAHHLVERIEHIGPQTVAEGIAQHDAIHFKRALEERGAKVKIKETVRVVSDGSRREPIPASVRREVWRRDGGKCVDCGSQERLEYDHTIPVSRGGANTVRNIQLRCETCNRKKGATI